MIKNVFLLTVILMPCLLAFNGSDNVLPNVIGVLYMLVLALIYRTNKGKIFFEKLASDTEKLNDKIFSKEDEQ